MTKVTLTTILLFLLTTISVFANNKSSEIYNNSVVNIISLENLQEATNNDIDIKLDDLKTDTNNVSYLVKYQLIKSTSRKSKMNNIQNFLKNPEKKEIVSNILC